jgi:hypothetical protein
MSIAFAMRRGPRTGADPIQREDDTMKHFLIVLMIGPALALLTPALSLVNAAPPPEVPAALPNFPATPTSEGVAQLPACTIPTGVVQAPGGGCCRRQGGVCGCRNGVAQCCNGKATEPCQCRADTPASQAAYAAMF